MMNPTLPYKFYTFFIYLLQIISFKNLTAAYKSFGKQIKFGCKMQHIVSNCFDTNKDFN